MTGVHGSTLARPGQRRDRGRRRRRRRRRATARFALHAGGGGRRSGDVDTPLGPLANSQSRNGFGNVGAGVDRRQGLSRRQLRLRRHALRHPGRRRRTGGVDAAPPRVLAARRRREPRPARSTRSGPRWRVRRYKHDELAAGEVDTAFTNDTTELELLASHRALGRLKGSVGGVVSRSRVRCARRRSAVAGGRSARRGRVPLRGADLAARDGAVRRPRGARALPIRPASRALASPPAPDRWGCCCARRRRRPRDGRAQPRARGAHPGARGAVLLRRASPATSPSKSAIPSCGPSMRSGFDAALRWRGPRVSGEVAYFRNSVHDFVFRRQLTDGGVRRAAAAVRGAVPVARSRRSPTASSRSSRTSPPTACCRASRRTATSACRRRSPRSSASITCAAP